MPFFVFIGYDGPRGSELRGQHRPAHLKNLESLSDAGRIRHAGPLLDPTGRPFGSLVVFEDESLQAARAWAARDPYVVEDVFVRYEVHETKIVFPK